LPETLTKSMFCVTIYVKNTKKDIFSDLIILIYSK